MHVVESQPPWCRRRLPYTGPTHPDCDSEMLVRSSSHHMNTLYVTQHRKCADGEGKSGLRCKETEAILQKVLPPDQTQEIVKGGFTSWCCHPPLVQTESDSVGVD